jgi:hypothetical protein
MKTIIISLLGLNLIFSQVMICQNDQLNVMFFKNALNKKSTKEQVNNVKKIRSNNLINTKTTEDASVIYLPLKMIKYEANPPDSPWSFVDSTEYLYYTTNPNKGKILQEVIYNYTFYTSSISKNLYKYNNFGKLYCISRYSYNSGNNSFDLGEIDTFIYNSANKLIRYEIQYKDYSTGNFKTSYKIEYLYNSQNKLIESIKYSDVLIDYSTNTYSLMPYEKIQIIYNSSGQYVSATLKNYTNNYFENSYMNKYFYDGTGKINKILGFSWNQSLNKWDTSVVINNVTWYKWNYNEFERLCDNLISSIEGKDYTTTYNNGQPLKIQVIYNYDSFDDQLIEEMDYYWDPASFSWVMYFHDQYVITRNPAYGNMMTQKVYQQYDFDSNKFLNFYKYVFKQPSLLGVSEHTEKLDNISVFPNPSNGTFKLNVNSNFIKKIQIIEVIDISGKIVKNLHPKELSEIQIDLSNFENGVYFFKINFLDNANNLCSDVLKVFLNN